MMIRAPIWILMLAIMAGLMLGSAAERIMTVAAAMQLDSEGR